MNTLLGGFELDLEDPLNSRMFAPDDAKNGELYVVEAVGGWFVAMFHDWKYIDLYTGQEVFGDILRYARLPKRNDND